VGRRTEDNFPKPDNTHIQGLNFFTVKGTILKTKDPHHLIYQVSNCTGNVQL
jgi:hypothetical protein